MKSYKTSKKRIEKIISFYNQNDRDTTLKEFQISSETLSRYMRLYRENNKNDNEKRRFKNNHY